MKILTKLLLSTLMTTGLTAGVIGTTTLLMNQRQDRMNAMQNRVETTATNAHQLQIALRRELVATQDQILGQQQHTLAAYRAAQTDFLAALNRLKQLMPDDPEVLMIDQRYQSFQQQVATVQTTPPASPTFQQQYQAMQLRRDQLTGALDQLGDRTSQQLQASHQQAIDFEEDSQVIAQVVGLVVFGLFLGQFMLILLPIIRSLQTLQAGATAIGSGNLDHQFNLQTGDEIEQLGQAFNQMAARLAELYQNLELKVAERTLELNQVNQNLATEIAEREAIEATLRQTEADNRALLETLPDLLVRMAGDGTYLDFVRAGEVAILGDGEKMVGRNIYDIIPAEEADRRMELVRHTLETGESQLYEYQLMVEGEVHDEEARIVLSGPDEVLIIVRDIGDRKRAERHLHLQHITTQLLAESPNLMIAIARLLESICESLGWVLGEFWTVESSTQSLQCISSQLKPTIKPVSQALLEFQAGTNHYTFNLGVGLPGQVWQQQQPIWITDITQDQSFQRANLALASGLRTALGFPVLSESQVLGVITLFTQDQRQPDPGLLTLMASIGSQIGQLMERLQVEEEVQRQTQQAQLLATMTLRIRQSLSLAKILNTTVAEVRQFLRTDRVVIYRFRPDWSGEVTVEAVGEDWMPIVGLTMQDPCFQTNHGSLYQKGQIRVISDIHQADLQPCHIELLIQLQVRAYLVVPISLSGSLWGLMLVHHCQGPRQWQSEEVIFLEQLSGQMAIALQQAELHQQLQGELQERRHAEIALRESEARLREQATQLQQALADLKQLQTQLIQTEKMSSLGQLVGGIAHEINNPVSFVHVNLNYVQEYANDLIQLLHLYQAECSEPSLSLQQAIADKDLAFIQADFPKILNSMQTGTERIRDIVQSLRNFSRLDEAELKTVDLHEGLDSTLMLLSRRLIARSNQPAIAVVRNYADPLPAVRCYAGQLNQVFMNILNNAIDALETGTPPSGTEPPTIWIDTALTATGSVQICIRDNGPGIPPNIQPRIFDPFFTTKPIGSGTGMGLAVSYQIVVERHQGHLICTTTPGEGTTFEIEIPQRQPEPTAIQGLNQSAGDLQASSSLLANRY